MKGSCRVTHRIASKDTVVDCDYRPAHTALQSIIAGYYSIKNPHLLSGRVITGLCKCALFLHIFHDDREMELSFGKTTTTSTYQGILGGQITGPTMIYCKEPINVISIEVLPVGLKQLFGISALELKEQIVSLRDIHFSDFDRLIDKLRHQISIEEYKKTLDEFFLRHFLYNDKIDSFRTCIDPLFRSSGTITVGELQKKSGLSKRQFERRFKEQAGISASTLRRFIRSSSALNRILHDDSVFNVVEALGYVDQSHLIKDIKWYTGKTPNLLHENYRNRVFHIGSATYILE